MSGMRLCQRLFQTLKLDEFVRRIFDEIKDNIDVIFRVREKRYYNYNPRLILKIRRTNIEEKLYIYVLVNQIIELYVSGVKI